MPSAPSITPFSDDARAGTAPAAIGFPFQFQMHKHLSGCFRSARRGSLLVLYHTQGAWWSSIDPMSPLFDGEPVIRSCFVGLPPA